ncbi:MAG: PD40 domain-containing protein [Cyclobacteriaceae bacterium]
MKIRSHSRLVIFAFVSIFFSFLTKGQNLQKIYQEGEKALNSEDYKNALEKYQEVSFSYPEYEATEYKIELCKAMSDDEFPIDSYLNLEQKYAGDEYYHYWLSKIYMSRYMFEDASATLKTFHQQIEYSGNTEDPEIQQLIERTNHLMSFFDNPDNYEIHQLESPINSSGDELSPVYFKEKNELVFASSRGSVYPKIYNIYYAKKDDNGWGSLTQVKNIGSFTESTANVEVVKDGKLFMFREENGGDLYFSRAIGDTWSLPIEFDSRISNNHLHSHFYINEHEDRIIFASDEKGAGLDLYESYKDPGKDKWTRPESFSADINTPYDEDSPYLSPDEKKLYFVSNRPGGVGGKDVYVSELDLEQYKWSEPRNMGWPVNSPDNEFHFKMDEDQTSGYFVSDRIHSKGENDIYFFWEVEKVNITGRLVDQEGKPMENVQIRFHPSQYLDEYFHSTTDANGIYSTKIISDEVFKVEILQFGRVIHNDRFEVHDAKGEAITHHKDFRIQ